MNKVIKIFGNKIEYATPGSAGMDIRAKGRHILAPQEVKAIPTGLFLEMPEGYEAQIRPRSGLSLKRIIIPNSPGTIDSDFRGEIKVIMMNIGNSNFIIEDEHRIAQMIFAKYFKPHFEYVSDISSFSKTNRGTGAFGSTGLL